MRRWTLRPMPVVFCAFVFDRNPRRPAARRDRRLHYIRESLVELDRPCRKGAGLIARGDGAAETRLAQGTWGERGICESGLRARRQDRDAAVAAALSECGIDFRTVKDQVLHDGDDIPTGAGRPYTVFTPMAALGGRGSQPRGVGALLARAPVGRPPSGSRIPTLTNSGSPPPTCSDLGIRPGMAGAVGPGRFPSPHGDYAARRDFPG